jgi:hypothetical protein
METPPGEPFIEEYGKMGLAYIEKLGKYTSCAYDIEGGPCASCGWQGRNDAEDYMRVAGRLANLFGSGGPEGAIIAQKEPRLMEFRFTTGDPPITGLVQRMPYGIRGSAQQFMELHDRPGQVVPPEGNGAALGDVEAELPIPEGCLSPTRSSGLDGQFNACDV